MAARRLWPERCALCGDRSGEAALCTSCGRLLVSIAAPCSGCGLPRPVQSCPRGRDLVGIDAVLAPYAYDGAVAALVQRAKFAGRRDLAHVLGQLLAAHLADGRGQVDAVVAVPLHASRLRERGYNQAYEIARPVARRLALPLLVDGIVRSRATAPQAELDASARRRNLRAAFSCRPLHARRIAIIDDVLTTGATVSALATALRRAGAVEVRVWACARALPPSAGTAAWPAPLAYDDGLPTPGGRHGTRRH